MVSVPSARYARTARRLQKLSPCGLHWEELDEDISIAGLLAGRGDETRKARPEDIRKFSYAGG
ncbi:MAG TPA: DUF2442 domain-containing protein [Stellaceae bacterium]|nr:DUF2442 domain-containing protein [Stellaceae bacterium]